MDTRLEEVERRAEIIILTRHDIPQLAATMMSQWHNGQCSHNLGRASTVVKILLRLHFQDWIGLRRRMCFCKISQNCRIMHNIAQLHNSAEYCTIAGSHNIAQWAILLYFSQSQLSLQRYAAWDNAKSSPILI